MISPQLKALISTVSLSIYSLSETNKKQYQITGINSADQAFKQLWHWKNWHKTYSLTSSSWTSCSLAASLITSRLSWRVLSATWSFNFSTVSRNSSRPTENANSRTTATARVVVCECRTQKIDDNRTSHYSSQCSNSVWQKSLVHIFF